MEQKSQDQHSSENEGVFDIPEEYFGDDTINIKRYLNIAILTAQKILPNSTLRGNIEDGFAAYSLQVEQAEALARAAKYLSEKYDEDLKIFLSSDELKAISKDAIRMAKIANKKLFLIMREISELSPYESKMFA